MIGNLRLRVTAEAMTFGPVTANTTCGPTTSCGSNSKMITKLGESRWFSARHRPSLPALHMPARRLGLGRSWALYKLPPLCMSHHDPLMIAGRRNAACTRGLSRNLCSLTRDLDRGQTPAANMRVEAQFAD